MFQQCYFFVVEGRHRTEAGMIDSYGVENGKTSKKKKNTWPDIKYVSELNEQDI
jgi:hypothetical protein